MDEIDDMNSHASFNQNTKRHELRKKVFVKSRKRFAEDEDQTPIKEEASAFEQSPMLRIVVQHTEVSTQTESYQATAAVQTTEPWPDVALPVNVELAFDTDSNTVD